jgi:hypothetical protein
VNASRSAVPVIVDEGLGAFEDPVNRQRLAAIMGSPEMQQAIREAAEAAIAGALEPTAESRGRAFAAGVTDSVADAMARDIRDKIVPAAVDAMHEAFDEANTPEERSAVRRFIDESVSQATTAAVRSASKELPTTLAPALRQALVENLNSPELRQAVSGVAADATRSALLSSRDVILQLREQGDKTGPFEHILERIERLLVVSIAVTFVIGTLLGALGLHALRHRSLGGPRGPGPAEPASGPPPRLDRAAPRAT